MRLDAMYLFGVMHPDTMYLFKTRVGSLAALLFCRTVILSLCHSVCLPGAMYIFLSDCLSDILLTF